MTRALAAPAAVALLALATLAAAERTGARPLPPAAGRAAAGLFLVLLGAALAASLIVVGLSAPAIRARRSKEPQRAPRRIPIKALDAGALLATLGVAVAVLVAILLALNGQTRHPAAVPGAGPVTRVLSAVDKGGRVAAPGVWLLAGAALVAGGAGLIWLRGRPRGRGGIAPRERSALGVLPGDVQRWPSDPREAVLAAYSRSETLLAHGGLGRRPSEGPREFRDRVRSLDAVDGPALARLTALYERARFSRHGITGAMGTEAIWDHSRLRRRLEDTWTP